MDVLVVSVNLRSVPLAALEALQDRAVLAGLEARLRELPGVREVVRIATCQRVLFALGAVSPMGVGQGSGPDSHAMGADQLASILDGSRKILSDALRETVRGSSPHPVPPREPRGAEALAADALASVVGESREQAPRAARDLDPDRAVAACSGKEAFLHLVRVAAGLDSLVRGEAEVLGQIRSAYADAVSRKETGSILNGFFHRAFRAARRIRAHAGLDRVSPSWSEFLAGTIVAGSEMTAGEPLHLIGTGSLARALSLSLRARGLVVLGPETLPESNAGGSGRRRVIVTASGRGRLLGAAELGLSVESEPHRLDVWDLGMPRNVDPGVALRPGVRVTTLAELECAAEEASRPLATPLEQAETLARDEAASYAEWAGEQGIEPSLVRVGRLLELLGTQETGEVGPADLRRRLLSGFSSLVNEAKDEVEALRRLALFEEALRRAAAQAVPRRRILRSRTASREPGAGTVAPGRVSLVGAGPGDPGLLTLEGAERLREADVVYVDALVASEVLVHCRPDVRTVFVGKRRGAATLPQNEIEEALVREARAGRSVVRLKGGDPFVFGRGGEEALALLHAGVPFDVVPGVSSGIAVPALAGIPLTHRGVSGSAAFVTAHDLTVSGEGRSVHDRLHHLARGAETLVVFMAGAELERVRETLLEAGLAPDTPAALIENGSTSEQRVETTTLDQLGSAHRPEPKADGPVLVVIGRTVALSARLRPQPSDEKPIAVPPRPRAAARPAGRRITPRHLPAPIPQQRVARTPRRS